MTANRIQVLGNAPRQRKWLVPFFTCGYPDASGTVALVQQAVAAGADLIELGMPFSDPVADGPAIQYSSSVALTGGMNLHGVLRVVEEVRKGTAVPIILMGYVNPMLRYGAPSFCIDMRSAGADGLIIPDLPVEESAELRRATAQTGLSLIQLVAPTSPKERIRMLAKASPDLLYAVTVAGVTGARSARTFDNTTYLAEVRKLARGPLIAGFGISSPDSAVQVCSVCDGAVVGSALVQILRESTDRPGGLVRVGKFLASIRAALDHAYPPE